MSVKPSLKILREFARKYVLNIKVVWEKMEEGVVGEADLEENILSGLNLVAAKTHRPRLANRSHRDYACSGPKPPRTQYLSCMRS